MQDKKIIENNFSRCAPVYDDYCDLQRQVGSELIRKTDGRGCCRILEIGCGTGNYTLLLREKFVTAGIVAVDISGRMIEAARAKFPGDGTVFTVADAEDLNLEGKFDLITANASLQWFHKLERAVQNYRCLLEEKGEILFSYFGPSTFRELRQVLTHIAGKKIILPSDNFLSREGLRRLLVEYFPAPSVEEQIFAKNYPSLYELLRRIKYTGERGAGMDGQVYPGRALLTEAEELYRKLFGGIRATYQVFFVKATKQ